MTDKITWIIMIVLIIAIIAMLVISIKKNKAISEQCKEETAKLKSALAENKEHLKYKNKITIQVSVMAASMLLLALSLIFLIFLPIFQIKLELLGITLDVKSFSIYDNYIEVANEYNASLNYFTDVNTATLKLLLIVSVAITVLYFPVFAFFSEIKCFNAERRTEKYFTTAKIYRTTHSSFDVLWVYALVIGIQIATIITCKNAEYKFISNIPYTVTDVDNYLYYYTNSGNFIIRVFQNNFKFFNGVSGYIAIPIICFVLAAALFIAGLYLKNKNKTEIMNEQISGFEEIKTV